MILLLGGTSETASFAMKLAARGYGVMVSCATDIPLHVKDHPRISRRSGPLDEAALAALLRESSIQAIVDVTHPYAVNVRATARRTASLSGIPYLTWVRPPAVREEDGLLFAENHEKAAKIACSFGCPVLLTTGSRNLEPYVREALEADVPLAVRVLPHNQSIQACRTAGVPENCLITGRGPFSVQENREVIRRFKIGVLVTKDSGSAGGVEAKLEAARAEKCRVVVVERPELPSFHIFRSPEELIHALGLIISHE